MDWDRVNVWTHTLYALIHSLNLAKAARFHDINAVTDSIVASGDWVEIDCSYSSILLDFPFGGAKTTFRRDPNKHFEQTSAQVVKMLVQDLVVILDEMMNELLLARGESAGVYPQSKVEKLSRSLPSKYTWASRGCLELIAVRNVLTHARGVWNDKSIRIVSSFVTPAPARGQRLSVGFAMLFRYRKAIRTFLNEVQRAPRFAPVGAKRR